MKSCPVYKQFNGRRSWIKRIILRIFSTSGAIITALLAIVLIMAANSARAAASTPIVLGTDKFYPLAGHLAICRDPSGTKTIDDLISTNASFDPLAGNLSMGYCRGSVWLRFTVLRTPGFEGTPVLSLFPPYLDHVDVYVVESGHDGTIAPSIHEYALGDHVPVHFRPPLPFCAFSSDIALPLDLPPGKQANVYLKIRTSSTTNLIGAIQTTESAQSHWAKSMMIDGAYLGIALTVCLINLIIFLRIRDELFLYFSGYVLALFINYLGLSGIISQLMPGSAHLLADYLVGMGMGLALSTIALFVRRLFETGRFVWIDQYLLFAVLTGMLTILSVPLDVYVYVAPLATLNILIIIVLTTGLSIYAVRIGELAGKIYLVAFGIGNFGYVFQALRLLGVMPLEFWNGSVIQLASLFNMLLMTLAVTERLREAECRMLDAVRESERNACELASRMTSDLNESKLRLQIALAAESLALKRQRHFLSMVSHEYRTPLAIIVGNVGLIEMQMDDRHYQIISQELGGIRSAADRLVKIMEVSLERSRLSDPKVQGIFKRVDMVLLIKGLVEEVRRLPYQNPIFIVESTDSIWVSGDEKYLTTVLFNLIDNAFKYSVPGTQIDITCSASDGDAVFAISNRVSGIDEGDGEYMFEKYWRGNTVKEIGGAGLGLWLVREIVKLHGGRVTLTIRDSMLEACICLPVDHDGC